MAQDFANLDLFSDENLTDPYPIYTALRESGPAVWLEKQQVWAVAGYDDVRAVLANHRAFISGEGIGLTPEANEATKGSILSSDPPVHGVLRRVLEDRLSPKAIRRLAADIQSAADQLVDSLVERGSFDGVRDLAQAFPVSVVVDLIGVTDEVRPKLLGWADDMFNAFGPPNARTMASLPGLMDMGDYLHSVTPDVLRPGSLGAAVYEAGKNGVLTPEQCAVLLGAYLGAGLDTTINSIAAAVKLFAEHPDQWDLLRRRPELVNQAFDEILRIETPVLGFTRVAAQEAYIGSQKINSGERVLVLYAAANRDPRKFPDPDRFDVLRAPKDHLAFGVGRHFCAGQGLARLEAEALLRAMAARIARFDIGQPIRHLNNVIRGLEKLPTRIEPSPGLAA